MQMPSTGRSFFKRSRTIEAPSIALIPSIHDEKAPTPGTTKPSASSATTGLEVTTTS